MIVLVTETIHSTGTGTVPVMAKVHGSGNADANQNTHADTTANTHSNTK